MLLIVCAYSVQCLGEKKQNKSLIQEENILRLACPLLCVQGFDAQVTIAIKQYPLFFRSSVVSILCSGSSDKNM